MPHLNFKKNLNFDRIKHPGNDRSTSRQQSTRSWNKPHLQPIYGIPRRRAATFSSLQSSDGRRICQRSFGSRHPEPALHMRSVRVHRSSVAYRKMPPVQRPASGQRCNLQWQMLHILRSPTGQFSRCADIL